MTCSLLSQSAMGHALCGIDQLAVRQYHADLRPGEEARREAFLNAARVADFAHVIGATHPKKNQASSQGFAQASWSKKHISAAE